MGPVPPRTETPRPPPSLRRLRFPPLSRGSHGPSRRPCELGPRVASPRAVRGLRTMSSRPRGPARSAPGASSHGAYAPGHGASLPVEDDRLLRRRAFRATVTASACVPRGRRTWGSTGSSAVRTDPPAHSRRVGPIADAAPAPRMERHTGASARCWAPSRRTVIAERTLTHRTVARNARRRSTGVADGTAHRASARCWAPSRRTVIAERTLTQVPSARNERRRIAPSRRPERRRSTGIAKRTHHRGSARCCPPSHRPGARDPGRRPRAGRVTSRAEVLHAHAPTHVF